MVNEQRKHSGPRFRSTNDVDIEKVIGILVSATDDVMKSGKKTSIPAKSTLELISKSITQHSDDNAAMLEMLPDTKQAMEILISSILSPKDMMTSELIFSMSGELSNSEAASAIIKIVENHFKEKYPLEKILPDILRSILFDTGSYPLLVLPENSIDDIINSPARVSIESMAGDFEKDGSPISIGILGKSGKGSSIEEDISLEEVFTPINELGKVSKEESMFNTYTIVTDNVGILKLPEVINKITSDRVSERLAMANITLENRNKKVDYKKAPTLYRRRTYKKSSVIPLAPPPPENKDVRGNPIIMKLPSESVIPVHVPGNPDDHIGYFVLLDKNGNPIKHNKDSKYIRQMEEQISRSSSQGQNNVSELIQDTRERLYGGKSTKDTSATNAETYTQLIEYDLNQRIRNGVYKEQGTVSNIDSVSRIMMARALAKMHTTVLFVPLELISYMAFDYRSNGTGKTILEDGRILASIRSMLLLSNTMASIKNSIGQTELNIELDPDDPDPNSTVEEAIHNFVRNNHTNYPLGTTNIDDITTFLQRANVDINVSGNSRYPGTRVAVEDKGRSVTNVDSDLEEKIKHRYISYLGVPPEAVDASMEVEFATNLIGSNLLLAKRGLLYQDMFTPHLEDFVRKYCSNSEDMLKEMEEAIKSSKVKLENEELDIITEAINGITIKLPTPDMARIEQSMEAFESYTALLDAALEAYFNPEIIDELVDSELSASIEPAKLIIRAHFQRRWLRNNNIMSELDELVQVGDDKKPLLDIKEIFDSHTGKLLPALEKLLRKGRKAGRKADAKLEKDEDKDAENGFDDDDETPKDDPTPPEETPQEDEVVDTPPDDGQDGGEFDLEV